MDFAAPHAGFVLIAYGISAVVLIALVFAVILDLRRQRRQVDRLDAADGESRPRRRAPATKDQS